MSATIAVQKQRYAYLQSHFICGGRDQATVSLK
jgi:hypothetical protein